MYENLSRNFLIQLADGLTYLSLGGNFNQISNFNYILLLETVITSIRRNIHTVNLFPLRGSAVSLSSVYANNDTQCVH